MTKNAATPPTAERPSKEQWFKMVDDILDLLKLKGPLTSTAVARELGLDLELARSVLNYMTVDGGVRLDRAAPGEEWLCSLESWESPRGGAAGDAAFDAEFMDQADTFEPVVPSSAPKVEGKTVILPPLPQPAPKREPDRDDWL